MRVFFVILVIACFLLALASPGWALSKTRPAPREALRDHATIGYPPHWRTWIKIGRCEQPGNGKYGIAWRNTRNYSYPGGMGFTKLNWISFRPVSAKRIPTMNLASIRQQLWAAERIYQHFARLHGTRYASSVWDCRDNIGWYGFNADGSWNK